MSKEPSLDLDALLADMQERFPGEEFTLDEIADYAGCSFQYIHSLERSAIAKLRTSLNDDILPRLGGADGEH